MKAFATLVVWTLERVLVAGTFLINMRASSAGHDARFDMIPPPDQGGAARIPETYSGNSSKVRRSETRQEEQECLSKLSDKAKGLKCMVCRVRLEAVAC